VLSYDNTIAYMNIDPLQECILIICYFPQLGQEERPTVEILNAAVRIASSG